MLDLLFDLWYLTGQTYDMIYLARKRELKRLKVHIERAGVLFRVKETGKEATPAYMVTLPRN